MTKLLEDAIKKVRELSAEEQDEAAEILLSVVSNKTESIHLDDETRAAIKEGLAQARRGEFVSDEDMGSFFKKHGVQR